jgi:beta-glucosidase
MHPERRGLDNFIPAIHHSALSQARGIRIAQSLRTDLEVGTTFSCSAVHPHTNREKDIRAALRVDALVNRLICRTSEWTRLSDCRSSIFKKD